MSGNCYNNNNNNKSVKMNKKDENERNPKSQSDVVNGGGECRGTTVFSGYREPEKPVLSSGFEPVELPLSNLERFLAAVTPSVHAHHLSKTTMRGMRTCDVEFQPYFMLSDLWDSFKEWSAYGVGVPLVLNGSESVVQYYVPYLSGIQLYADPLKSAIKSRRTSEDSDGDCFSRDSSSDGSSDSERDRALRDISFKMERLSSKDQHVMFSSEDGDTGTSRISLLFQYLEHNPPFCREPLADKISDLAVLFPELKSLRSCDLLSTSWLSVAWYPIYRIPMGPTLKDLDACFLTYHSLYTPVGDAPVAQAPVVIYPNEIGDIPRMSLPVCGLSSYKFRGPLWTSSSGSDRQLVNTLLQAADSWLRLLQVNHPDYLFFGRSR